MTEKKMQVSLFDIISFNSYFNWGKSGVGFGQFSLGIKADDTGVRIIGARECMSKESLREAMHAMIDTVIDALPADDDLDRDHFDVKIPFTPEVIAERAEWRRLVEGDGP